MKLFTYREERIHPHKDDKILTSWNGLMIAALAKGASAFQDPHYLDMAKKAAQMKEDGFYFSGSDSEALLTRPKEVYDGAIPSGNSVMTFNLIRHARLTGQEKYQEILEKQVQAFAHPISHYPSGYSFFLTALQMLMGSSQEIVITEGHNKDVYAEMIQQVQQAYKPFSVLVLKGNNNQEKVNDLAAVHQDKQPLDGKTALYLCENFACQQPVFETKEVEQLMNN
jgi:uncharacterized protein YyaL (SSP411 family)